MNAEDEADALARAAPASDSRLPRPAISEPVPLRRKAETWAGSFETDKYLATFESGSPRSRYGAEINLRFEPNEKVDAKKIALAQTAQSALDDQPVSIYFRDPDPTPGGPDPAPKKKGVDDTKKSALRDTPGMRVPNVGCPL